MSVLTRHFSDFLKAKMDAAFSKFDAASARSKK